MAVTGDTVRTNDQAAFATGDGVDVVAIVEETQEFGSDGSVRTTTTTSASSSSSSSN